MRKIYRKPHLKIICRRARKMAGKQAWKMAVISCQAVSSVPTTRPAWTVAGPPPRFLRAMRPSGRLGQSPGQAESAVVFGDKCGSFSDGVGQFVGIEKSPCIDQRLPAIGASKIRDQRVGKVLFSVRSHNPLPSRRSASNCGSEFGFPGVRFDSAERDVRAVFCRKLELVEL